MEMKFKMEFIGLYDSELFSMDEETCLLLYNLMDDVIAKHLLNLFNSKDFIIGKKQKYGKSLIQMEKLLRPKAICLTLNQKLNNIKLLNENVSVADFLKSISNSDSLYRIISEKSFDYNLLKETLKIIIDNEDNLLLEIPKRSKDDWDSFKEHIKMVSVKALLFHNTFGYPYNPKIMENLVAVKDIFYVPHEIKRNSGLSYIVRNLNLIYILYAYLDFKAYEASKSSKFLVTL